MKGNYLKLGYKIKEKKMRMLKQIQRAKQKFKIE